jgi:putative inorganic carbon (HCO3(-)) transporter
MLGTLRSQWILVTCVVFVLLNAILVANEFYWLNLLPAVLLVVWAMFTAVDRLMLFIAFVTPLSINLEELEIGGIGVSLPTEPILVGLMFLFLLKLSIQSNVLDARIWRHPITWVICIQLIWTAVCIVPSSMPVVSLKNLVARLWFICTAYFLATRLFEDRRNMYRFGHAYIAGLAIVIVYTLVRHAQFHFEHDPAHWVMTPFFKDHTSYGASIALFLPFALSEIVRRETSRSMRGLAFFMTALLITGLVFSYTRAAWLSLVGALGVFLVLKLRIPGWVVGALMLTAGGVYWANHEQITIALERNREESSDNMGEHVRSISNISSDASNLERINRWNSALRMWKERPVFGWGPGTYMFQYAPFQASEDRTIISTNFGSLGNAHSEYLGPLSEQGALGLLLMIALVAVTVVVALRLYKRMPRGSDRSMFVSVFLGLTTYYLHGALNNFLDTDKVAVPFWAFTAIVVLMDLRYPPAEKAATKG